MLFDLMDMTYVKTHIVYLKLGDDISLQNFKIVVAKALIGRYSNCNRLFSTTRLGKRKSHELSMTREVPTHMLEFQQKRVRCHYCKNESSDLKSFVSWQACGLYLCLTKERNYLLKHYLQFFITISLLIIYLLENRQFLCFLCSQICVGTLHLTKNAQIQLQSFLKSIYNSRELFIELYIFQ